MPRRPDAKMGAVLDELAPHRESPDRRAHGTHGLVGTCALLRRRHNPSATDSLSVAIRCGGEPGGGHMMEVRFAVFMAVTLDGYIARADGSIDFLAPFHDEEHGYASFFAGVDALVIGRGTYDTVLAFPEWPYGRKRVIVCTTRPSAPAHGEEMWSGPPRQLADRLGREGVRRVYLDG